VASSNISLMSLTGLLAVIGMAVRGGIDMLRHAQKLNSGGAGSSPPEVVLRAAGERVVPILTSAIVTLGALLPFVLARNLAGVEILHSAAAVIVGGVIGATIFLLGVLPVMCARMQWAAQPDPTVA
jgi:Cu/Ag efflux pump CusA